MSQDYLDTLGEKLLDAHHLSEGDKKAHHIENGTIWPQKAYTMIGRKRLNNVRECCEDVIKNGIEGDFIETGVWRGGTCIFMRGLLKYYGENRKVFVADSFEGLPPPDPKYPVDKGDALHKEKYLAVDLETVKGNFKEYELLDDNVVFIKGFFENTLKDAPIDKLAILRLDGDMYSSTIQVLDSLYDKVTTGGYIIIDDYALRGCNIAVNDFRRNRGIMSPIIPIDWTGIYWKKE